MPTLLRTLPETPQTSAAIKDSTARACLIARDALSNLGEYLDDPSPLALLTVKQCEAELDKMERMAGISGGSSDGLAFFVATVETNGGLKDEKNVVTSGLYFGDDLGDLVGIGDGFVDGLAQLLHEFLQSLIHSKGLSFRTGWLVVANQSHEDLDASVPFQVTPIPQLSET